MAGSRAFAKVGPKVVPKLDRFLSKISGGRLMMTSLSILTLEVYYRHLPLYYRDMGDRRVAGK